MQACQAYLRLMFPPHSKKGLAVDRKLWVKFGLQMLFNARDSFQF